MDNLTHHTESMTPPPAPRSTVAEGLAAMGVTVRRQGLPGLSEVITVDIGDDTKVVGTPDGKWFVRPGTLTDEDQGQRGTGQK